MFSHRRLGAYGEAPQPYRLVLNVIKYVQSLYRLVLIMGLEPIRARQGILSPHRLPIPTYQHILPIERSILKNLWALGCSSVGDPEGTRTPDFNLVRIAFYQLNYWIIMVRHEGFEPSALALKVPYSTN